jgi:hypothetical protein
MPGIESLELSGSLGREPDYSDNDGKDSGKLKVNPLNLFLDPSKSAVKLAKINTRLFWMS